MNTATAVVLGVSGLVAILDWVAVARDRRPAEYVLKPATLALLIVAAVLLDPADGAERTWFVVALGWSLAGDVFLMLPRDRFLPGLASFLLAHVAYVVGLNLDGGTAGALLAASGAVAVVALPLAIRIVRGVRGGSHPELAVPVVAYIVVISSMVVSAVAAGDGVAIAGAALFYASDALIGWTRFVGDLPHGRLAVMVTYHLGQAGLVLSLISW